MAIRRLWQADSERIKKLLQLRSQLGASKLSDDEMRDFEGRIDAGLRSLNSVYWGDVNQDGSLRCLLLQVLDDRWPNTWNAALVATDGSAQSWNYKLNGLDDLWRIAFTWGRTKGRYEVVWSLPVAWARTRRRTANTSDEWLKYDIQELDVVPEGEMPSDQFKLWAFGGTTKSYPVQLRLAVPKKELLREGSKPLQASDDRRTSSVLHQSLPSTTTDSES